MQQIATTLCYIFQQILLQQNADGESNLAAVHIVQRRVKYCRCTKQPGVNVQNQITSQKPNLKQFKGVNRGPNGTL
jgi:hypothetical protein